jgi:hypothetical protein
MVAAKRCCGSLLPMQVKHITVNTQDVVRGYAWRGTALLTVGAADAQ